MSAAPPPATRVSFLFEEFLDNDKLVDPTGEVEEPGFLDVILDPSVLPQKMANQTKLFFYASQERKKRQMPVRLLHGDTWYYAYPAPKPKNKMFVLYGNTCKMRLYYVLDKKNQPAYEDPEQMGVVEFARKHSFDNHVKKRKVDKEQGGDERAFVQAVCVLLKIVLQMTRDNVLGREELSENKRILKNAKLFIECSTHKRHANSQTSSTACLQVMFVGA